MDFTSAKQAISQKPAFLAGLIMAIRRVCRRIWRSIARSISSILFTVREAVRIPISDLLRYSRANYYSRRYLDVSALGDELSSAVQDSVNERYARTAVVAAYCHLLNFRTHCRAAILGLIVGVAIFAAWWAYALFNTTSTLLFFSFSVLVTVTCASLCLPWVVGQKSWQGVRILVVGIGFAILAAYSLDSLSSPLDTIESVTVDIENASLLGLSFFGLALLCGVGAFCAASSTVIAYWISRRRSYRSFPRELMVVVAARLVRDLRRKKPGIATYEKDAIIRDLGTIVKCLRYGAIDSDRVYDPVARKNIKQRFEASSNFVVQLQQEIVLEKYTTVGEVQAHLNRVCIAALTEMYFYLPDSADSDRQAVVIHRKSMLRSAGKAVRRVFVAVVPFGALLLVSKLSISIPDSLLQWATGISFVWLLGHLFLLLDPRLSWQEVREVVTAGKPTEK